MITPEQSRPSRATIDRHLNAVYLPFAMVAGVELGVFTALKDGPKTAEALAQGLGVDAFRLEPLLYALVMADLMIVEDGRFANTPEAGHYLVQGRPDYIGGRVAHYGKRWVADLKTTESIRTGVPQGKIDFTSLSDSELTTFFTASHATPEAIGRQLVETHDLCRFGSLLDVAGGSGGLAIEACRHCPELQATVIDLPAVTPITQRFVAEAGMNDRVSVASLDVVDQVPEDRYNVATMANLIQVLARDQAQSALINVGRALAPGGVLIIYGWILDDSQLSPPQIAISNFAFLNIYDEGRAYTEAAYRAWLSEAGFTSVERRVLPSGKSIVRAAMAG